MVTPLPVLIVWFAGSGIQALAFATAAVVSVPLFLYARPSGFAYVAGAIAALLVLWSFIGAMAGMFLFFPSALQLLLATGADPRERPTAAKVMAGAGLLLSAAVVVQSLRS
ncbi:MULTISPECIES: hypothetical protein [unclassified Streptomyces]|uniref:hypothetical protein n=1 Tax=unclassified Streptomyces TaxID=2593676 RepID=UPI0029672761|nr:hypothetical protein [Streptomyces sp. SJL17-1]